MTALGGEFDVMRVVVLPVDNDEILEASGDIKLAIPHETQVAGSKKWSVAAGEHGPKGFFGFFWPSPITQRNVWARDPDFSYTAWSQGFAARRIYDSNILTAGGTPATD